VDSGLVLVLNTPGYQANLRGDAFLGDVARPAHHLFNIPIPKRPVAEASGEMKLIHIPDTKAKRPRITDESMEPEYQDELIIFQHSNPHISFPADVNNVMQTVSTHTN
jgi:hypothetical protein